MTLPGTSGNRAASFFAERRLLHPVYRIQTCGRVGGVMTPPYNGWGGAGKTRHQWIIRDRLALRSG